MAASFFNRSGQIFSALSVFTLSFFAFAAESEAQRACGHALGQDIEVFLMLDFTGSSKVEHVADEKKAAKALLANFAAATPKPRVALGSFNTTGTLHAPLTTDYQAISEKIDSLPEKGSGFTEIKAALDTARLHLNTAGKAGKTKYVILFSDGLTRHLPDVKTTAALLKSEGTYIFAVHYPAPKDPVQKVPGADLMKNFIASQPSAGFFLSVEEDLANAVETISFNIGCEDGIQCTTDFCNRATGLCVSEDRDGDSDGVSDCSDKCPNQDDSALPPDAVLIDDDGDGILSCQDECPDDYNKITPGFCGCGQPDADADRDGYADCLQCAMRDLRPLKTTLFTGFTNQVAAVKKAAKKAKKAKTKKISKQGAKSLKAVKKFHKEALALLPAVPDSLRVCKSSSCTANGSFKKEIERLREIAAELQKLDDSLVRLTGSKSAGKQRRRIVVIGGGGIKNNNSSYINLIDNLPDGAPECIEK